jgi:phosphoribosylaminoimidazole-succinocarboxamide synthase
VPEMTDEWIQTISGRYIDLYEKLIGMKFEPQLLTDDETKEAIVTSIASLTS